MQSYSHTDQSLVEILSRLTRLNESYDNLLVDNSSAQQNQANALRSLGMVVSNPKSSEVNNSPVNGAEPKLEQTVLSSLVQEVNRFERNLEISKYQIEDARFIGEAIYRQGITPTQVTGSDYR